jgi:hypothetical protein
MSPAASGPASGPGVSPLFPVVVPTALVPASSSAVTIMAPNFLFPCNNLRVMGGERVCFTNTFDPRNVALDAACAAQPMVCLDAITRGLMSGLQPIVSAHDSVLPEGYF